VAGIVTFNGANAARCKAAEIEDTHAHRELRRGRRRRQLDEARIRREMLLLTQLCDRLSDDRARTEIKR
jgi:hypothetical protein